jgi:hypothetical protein
MLKQPITGHWNFMRILRLILGAVFLFGGVLHKDNLSVFTGVFLLFQAVFNASCCSTSSCAQNSKTSGEKISPEKLKIDVEEVNSKH